MQRSLLCLRFGRHVSRVCCVVFLRSLRLSHLLRLPSVRLNSGSVENLQTKLDGYVSGFAVVDSCDAATATAAATEAIVWTLRTVMSEASCDDVTDRLKSLDKQLTKARRQNDIDEEVNTKICSVTSQHRHAVLLETETMTMLF